MKEKVGGKGKGTPAPQNHILGVTPQRYQMRGIVRWKQTLRWQSAKKERSVKKLNAMRKRQNLEGEVGHGDPSKKKPTRDAEQT